MLPRLARPDDLPTIYGWATKENWNPGEKDIDVFMKWDPSGFYVIDNEDKTGLVAAIAVVECAPDEFEVAYYVTDESYRGKGIGKKLWEYVFGLKNCYEKNVILHADPWVTPMYEKIGFKLSHYVQGYYFKKTPEILALAPRSDEITIESNDSVNYTEVAHYDNKITKYNRQSLLEDWVNISKAVIKVAKNKAGEVVGFGIVRKGTGAHIAPLYADTASIAISLVLELLEFPGAEELAILETPSLNENIKPLVEAFNLKEEYKVNKLYWKHLPAQEYNKTFGIFALDLFG